MIKIHEIATKLQKKNAILGYFIGLYWRAKSIFMPISSHWAFMGGFSLKMESVRWLIWGKVSISDWPER